MAKWVRVAGTDEIADGTGQYFDVDGEPIAIWHVDGQFYATTDICSHEESSLTEGELDGEVIECALHGARFNVRTGKVLSLPAVVGIKTYPVRVAEGQIEIEM
jgi:nitrite reductase/ring-hydroxylating ferredoxin subunit